MIVNSPHKLLEHSLDGESHMKTSARSIAFPCIPIMLLASCQWSVADQEAPALYEIKEDGKWGFINRQGEVVVEPQFDLVLASPDNAITARSEAGWFAVHSDESQAVVMKLPFDATCRAVWELAPGLYAIVTPQGTAEILDVKGRFDARVDDDSYFGLLREGLLPIKQAGKWGAVDRSGRIVIKPSFDFMDNFFERKAAVLVGKKWGYVDFKGEMIIEPRFRVAGEFVGGIACVYDGKEYSYIKPDGTAAFDARFPFGSSFSNGRAIVANSRHGLRGYIDSSGHYAIEPRYTLAGNFSEGFAGVEYFRFPKTKREKVAGYIDLHGNLVIPVRNIADLGSMLSLHEFHHGLALVNTDDGTGYIDKNGKWVWKTKARWLPSRPEDIVLQNIH